MTNTAQEGESRDATISAKELSSYNWKGMRNDEGLALFEGSEPIKVTVGVENNQKTWYLPKKVLTHCSPFFDAALNGNFVEASSNAVDLPEDDPDAFAMWAVWLSLGKGEGLFENIGFAHAYVRAWKLGDELACPAFKDHVMYCLLCWFGPSEIVECEFIRFVYKNSSPGSKLRRFFVDTFVRHKQQGYLAEDADEFINLLVEIPEFLEDSMKLEMKAGQKDIIDPWEEQHRYFENPAFKPGT